MKRVIFLIACLFTYMKSDAQTAFEKHLDKLYQRTVPLISPQDFSSLDPKSLYVLDTREVGEYQTSHIARAQHVGYDHFDMHSVENIPKDAKIVVYCSVGYRSERIGEKLQEAGFKNVYNLYGGIFHWFNNERAVVDKAGKATDNIHTYNKKWSKWVVRGNKIW